MHFVETNVTAEVEGPFGTVITIAYKTDRLKWWWIGIWCNIQMPRLPNGWSRERHPEKGLVLLSKVVWNQQKLERLSAEAIDLVGTTPNAAQSLPNSGSEMLIKTECKKEVTTMATKSRKYRSPALRSLHEAMTDVHSVGAVDAKKMAQFDTGCLKEDKKKKASKDAKTS